MGKLNKCTLSGILFISLFGLLNIQANDEGYVFSLKFSSAGSGDGQLDSPLGVNLAPDGKMYVVDTNNHRIQKFDSNGNFLLKWGSWGSSDGKFIYPSQAAIDTAGVIYVTDTDNHRIQKFDGFNGIFIRKWGSWGSGDGQFKYPSGIAVDNAGNVYVADRWNNRIEKFDGAGTFLLKWGSAGSSDGQFNDPYGVAVDSTGSVYVADQQNNRIQKFDNNGNFLLQWGSAGSGDGQFDEPYGVVLDSVGLVYVTDNRNHRIQKFDSSGNFLLKWGALGTGDGTLKYPSQITVDNAGNVYVADTGNYRIQKFAHNYYPNIPNTPSPLDNTKNLEGIITLSWQGGDPDTADTVSYDIYFGKTLLPTFVVTQSSVSYVLTTLELGTTYYWKIVANDDQGFSQESPVWSFVTAAPQEEVIPKKLIVYPNPYKPNSGLGQRGMVFNGLNGKSKIEIYNLNGEKVRDIEVNNDSREYTWDGRNGEGESLASGIYLYVVTDDLGKKTGKVAIIK